MPASTELGRRIRAALVLADRTADDLAAEVGMSLSTLGRVMQGRRAVRTGEVEALARALGVPEAFLREGFDGAPARQPDRDDRVVDAIDRLRDDLRERDERLERGLAQLRDQLSRAVEAPRGGA